jgi:hypothetical protein
MSIKKYERVAGVVTHGETFNKLNETLIECEELCAVLAHLHATEDSPKDRLLATGWRGVSQLMYRIRAQVIKLAQGRMQ